MAKVAVIGLMILMKYAAGDPAETISCSKFELNTLWTSSLRDSPLMATPLLIDVDGDSLHDIVAPSYSGEVYAIHGENGHIVDNWPFYLENRAFYASPLAYDVDSDGVMDIVLTTTDAEIVFLKPDSTIFHGETVKIPPLRVRKEWYMQDSDYIEQLAAEMMKQVPVRKSSHDVNTEDSRPYSEFDFRMGHNANALYSRHQPEERLSGIDPDDNNYVFIDPHVLATPVITDLNEDGDKSEMIIPVSYYFDNYQYGNEASIGKTKLSAEELVDYAAAGIVIVDLKTREIVKQKLLSLTKLSSDQPAYLLAPPTVVKLGKHMPMCVIIGSVAGQLHVLQGAELQETLGFPITMDSISAQVAVEDVTGDGFLEMVVGDDSGNIVCVNHKGVRLWEQETQVSIESSVRFANLYSDESMEIILVTKFGDLWVLNGRTGLPDKGFPMTLNTLVHSSVHLLHLSPSTSKSDYHLSAVIPAISGMYIVDLNARCVDMIPTSGDMVPHTVQSDHIDPFNPGLELLATSLSGELVCLSTGTVHPPDFDMSIETWPSDALNGNGFTHKKSSFALVCGRGLSTRDASGKTFLLNFKIHDKQASETTPRSFNVTLSIGRRYILLKESVVLTSSLQSFEYYVPTPPIPTRSTMTLEICNDHDQCDYASYTVRFNVSFEDTLAWCLALPFFALVASYLWLLRNESTISLPTVIKIQKRS